MKLKNIFLTLSVLFLLIMSTAGSQAINWATDVDLFLYAENSSISSEFYGTKGTVGGMYFDGSSSYVDPNIPIGNTINTFEIEANISTTLDTTTSQYIFGSSTGTPDTDKTNIGINIVSGLASLSIRNSAGVSEYITGTTSLFNSKHTVKGKYTGNVIELYVDDVLEASASFSGTLEIQYAPPIGAINDKGGLVRYFQGTIGNFKYTENGVEIYNNPLTQLSDLSSNSNNTTAYNGVSVTNDNSFDFDGVNDYIDTGINVGSDLTTTFTFSSWVKFDNPTSGDNEYLLSPYYPMNFFKRGAESKIYWQVKDSSDVWHQTYWDIVPTPNTWYHIVGVYSPSSTNLYINGNLVSTTSGGSSLLSHSSDRIYVGGNAEYSNAYLNGELTTPMIFDRELDSSEVSDLYTKGRTYNPSTEPPIPPSGNITITESLILPVDPNTEDSLLGYCNSTANFEAQVSYNYKWYKNNILNKSGNSYLGTNWTSNSSLTLGIEDRESGSSVSMYNYSGNLIMITGGETWDFNGYDWNGTGWESNSSLTSGLVNIFGYTGSYSSPTMFEIDNRLMLISGEYYGRFAGYSWTGSTWVLNTTLISGLVSRENDPTIPNVYNYNNSIIMLLGAGSRNVSGYSWTGSTWVLNTTLISGLGSFRGYSSPAMFEKENKLSLIFGDSGSPTAVFKGYEWNGTGWETNNNLIEGLSPSPYEEYPEVSKINNEIILISGNAFGEFNGYSINTKFYDVNKSYNIDAIPSSELNINDNWTLECQATNGSISSIKLNSTEVNVEDIPPEVTSVSIDTIYAVEELDVLGSCLAEGQNEKDINYTYTWNKNMYFSDDSLQLIESLMSTDFGSNNYITKFQEDDNNYAIGYSLGEIKGYEWNGTNWEDNSDIIVGLPIGLPTSANFYPTVFQIGSTYHMIAKRYAGYYPGNSFLNGYSWTGSTWVLNSTIISGISESSSSNSIALDIFEDKLIITEDKIPNSYEWSGSTWTTTTYHAGLPSLFWDFSVFEISNREILYGTNGTDYFAYEWSGLTWTENNDLMSGISRSGKVGSNVFELEDNYYFIRDNLSSDLESFKIAVQPDPITSGTIIKLAGSTNTSIPGLNNSSINYGDEISLSCKAKYIYSDYGIESYTPIKGILSFPNINISNPLNERLYLSEQSLNIKINETYPGIINFTALPKEYESGDLSYETDVLYSYSGFLVEGYNNISLDAKVSSVIKTSEYLEFWIDANDPIIEYTEDTTVNPESDSMYIELEINEPCLSNTTFRLYSPTGMLLSSQETLDDSCKPGYTSFDENQIRSYNFTSIPNGVYYTNSTVTSIGDRSSTTSTILFQIGNGGPVVEILSPSQNWQWYAVDPSILSRVTSTQDIDECYYIYNEIKTIIPCIEGEEFLISGLGFSEGINSVIVGSNDTNGNSGIESIYFYKDSVTPIIDFESPTPENDTIIVGNQFQIKTSISTGNVDYVRLAVYNESGDLYESYIDSNEPYEHIFVVSKNGNYKIQGRVTNKAGVNSFTDFRDITVLGNPPEINMIIPENNGKYNYDVPIKYEVTGDNTDFKRFSKNPTINTSDNSQVILSTSQVSYFTGVSNLSNNQECFVRTAVCKNGNGVNSINLQINSNPNEQVSIIDIKTCSPDKTNFSYVSKKVDCLDLIQNPVLKYTCPSCDITNSIEIVGNSYSSGSSVIWSPSGTVNLNYDFLIDVYGANVSCNYSYNGGSEIPTPCGVSIEGIEWNEGDNNLSINVIDSLGNSNSENIDFVKDTVKPIITIRSPELDNSSEFYGTTKVDFKMSFIDDNLFGFQLECYDNAGLSGDAEYYKEVTDIAITSYPFSGQGTFQTTGRKYCKVTASDDHTVTNFSADVEIKEKLFFWEFNGISFDRDNVNLLLKSEGTDDLVDSLEYIERQDRISPVIKIKEQSDEYWKNYFKSDDYQDKEITLYFNIKAKDHRIYYREPVSNILGHVAIVPNSGSHADGYWYDVESNVNFNSVSTNMISIDELQYEIKVDFRELQDKDFTIETNSIGGLNFAEEYFNFQIYTGNEVEYNAIDRTTGDPIPFQLSIVSASKSQIVSENTSYEILLDCEDTTIVAIAPGYMNTISFEGDACSFGDKTFEFWQSELTINVLNKVSGDLIEDPTMIINMTNYNVDVSPSSGSRTFYTRAENYAISASQDNYIDNTASGSLSLGDKKTVNIELTPIYNVSIFREHTLEPFNFIQQIGDPYDCSETTIPKNVTTAKLSSNQIVSGNFSEEHPKEEAWDGLWDTYSTPELGLEANITFTFFKEENSYNTSYLKIKTSQSTNKTYIMEDNMDCWEYESNILHIKTQSDTSRTYLYCENNTGYRLMDILESGGSLYEAQMYFTNEIEEPVEKECYDTESITMKMYVACEDRKIERTISSANFVTDDIDCDYEYIEFSIFYDEDQSGHYRRLIPDKNGNNWSVYMLDQNYDIPIEYGVTIYDVTGDYSVNGRVRIYTRSNNTQILVYDDPLDQENKVTLYLEKDKIYSLCAVDNDGVETCDPGKDIRVDVADEITLTLPNMQIGGVQNAGDVDWSYDIDNAIGKVQLTYEDSENKTDSIRWYVYEGTTVVASALYSRDDNSSVNASEEDGVVTMSIFGLDTKKTYNSEWLASREGQDQWENKPITFTFNNITFWGFEGDEVCVTKESDINGQPVLTQQCKDKTSEMLKAFIACFVPLLVLMIFSRASGEAGMVASLVVGALFQSFGWLWYFDTILQNSKFYFLGFWGMLGLIAAISWYNKVRSTE